MNLSRLALVGLLATQLPAQSPNAAALQGIEAAIQATEQAIEQSRASGVDTRILEENLKAFRAQKAALQRGGGEGNTTGGNYTGGQSPAGVGMTEAMAGLQKAMSAMGGAGGQPGKGGFPGMPAVPVPGTPGAAAADVGPFTGSLMALRSGFAMLKAYGQPTSDLEKRVKAILPQAKELDQLTMKMLAATAGGKLPPEDLEDRYDTLVEKLEPELDAISLEMDKRSEAMAEAMEAQAAAMEADLDSSAEAMERALEMQEKMLEAQERMLEDMGN